MPVLNKLQDNDVRHGTKNGYDNCGCRCSACRTASSAAKKVIRAKVALIGLPDGDSRHGTYNGYSHYGCRCESCTQIASISTISAKLRITHEQTLAMRQISECELCGTEFGDKTPNIDHSHKTGKVRGALCHPCNLRLGQFENERTAKRTAKWLEQVGLKTVETYIERGV